MSFQTADTNRIDKWQPDLETVWTRGKEITEVPAEMTELKGSVESQVNLEVEVYFDTDSVLSRSVC